jgi:hypothetical protein
MLAGCLTHCCDSRSCLAASTHLPTSWTGTVSTSREAGAAGGVLVYWAVLLALQGVQ